MREANIAGPEPQGRRESTEHVSGFSPYKDLASETTVEEAVEPATADSGGYCKEATWWLDWFFKLFGDQFMLPPLVLAVVIYAVGFAISWTIDFAPDYLKTVPLYVGLAGIVWTGAYVGWGRKRICQLLGEIEPVFRPSGPEYAHTASTWLRRLLDWRPQLGMSALAIAASCVYAWYATGQGQFPWFPASWSAAGPNLWLKSAVLFMYAIPILILVTSALVFIGVFTLFVLSVRRLTAIPLPPAALSLLRPLADFGSMLCLGWSVGVSLFIWFFQPGATTGSVLLVVLLSVVALMILVAPQYAIHCVLLKMQRSILEAATMEFASITKTDKVGLREFVSALGSEESQGLFKVVESVSGSRTWVYSFGSLLPLVTPIGLPVAAFVLSQVVGG